MTCSASSETVWCWKMSLIVYGDAAILQQETTRIERMESPPRLKKLSSMPTCSPEHFLPDLAHRLLGLVTRSHIGAIPVTCVRPGRALRSTLPFAVSGSVEHHEPRRHHVVGQSCLQTVSEPADRFRLHSSPSASASRRRPAASAQARPPWPRPRPPSSLQHSQLVLYLS